MVLILDILGQSWLSIVEVETEKSDLHWTDGGAAAAGTSLGENLLVQVGALGVAAYSIETEERARLAEVQIRL